MIWLACNRQSITRMTKDCEAFRHFCWNLIPLRKPNNENLLKISIPPKQYVETQQKSRILLQIVLFILSKLLAQLTFPVQLNQHFSLVSSSRILLFLMCSTSTSLELSRPSLLMNAEEHLCEHLHVVLTTVLSLTCFAYLSMLLLLLSTSSEFSLSKAIP